MSIPALIYTSDFLPNQGALNGRRWAAQLLFRLWLNSSGDQPIDLLSADPELINNLQLDLRKSNSNVVLNWCPITDPSSIASNGALFIPDPSISMWSAWRQSVSATSFSIIGQIHTLSTPAVMSMIDSLVYDPVEEWDALICSSSVGKTIVQKLLDDRREQLRERCGASIFPEPKLPVIPLPLDQQSFDYRLNSRQKSRESLKIPRDAKVALWLGRRSILTKADLWQTYHVLQRVAVRLQQPVWLIECGPDDTSQQADHLDDLKKFCPDLSFLRLGGSDPVSEELKKKAISACDVVVSLVDNIQETFGLSIAEAMAAQRPVVASDWDGYRDLIRNGVDGFLIPSRWVNCANDISFPLGWMQKIDPNLFPHISGCLAQLVQLDLTAAEDAIITLFINPSLANAMGKQGYRRALSDFSSDVVMNSYRQLFDELSDIRKHYRRHQNPCSAPLRFDPVSCFSGFASHEREIVLNSPMDENLHSALMGFRKPFIQFMQGLTRHVDTDTLLECLARKHHQ